jgi:hypothetical protein
MDHGYAMRHCKNYYYNGEPELRAHRPESCGGARCSTSFSALVNLEANGSAAEQHHTMSRLMSRLLLRCLHTQPSEHEMGWKQVHQLIFCWIKRQSSQSSVEFFECILSELLLYYSRHAGRYSITTMAYAEGIPLSSHVTLPQNESRRWKD